jgi:hypothetical protein
MSVRDADLQAARERAHAARTHFQAALGQVADRFAPARLKEDAAMAASHSIDEAKDALRRTAQRHPLILSTVIGALAVLILWRPIGALVRTGRKSARAARGYMEQWRRSHGG